MRDILSSIIKWFFDKLIAILGILFLFFPFLITIAAIKIDSPGVAVFKQARVGKNMKVFYVYKFRTLRSVDVPFDVNNPVIPYDSKQVTRVGRFLRRYKVDEFLELLNVLKGDM
ncbi:MAG: sugar transferase, partial [Christensenellales bacterium]